MLHQTSPKNTPTENTPTDPQVTPSGLLSSDSDDPSPLRERFLRRADVCAKYGISTSTLYRWLNCNSFPRPVKLGPGVVAWRDSELAEFDTNPEGWAAKHGCNENGF